MEQRVSLAERCVMIASEMVSTLVTRFNYSVRQIEQAVSNGISRLNQAESTLSGYSAEHIDTKISSNEVSKKDNVESEKYGKLTEEEKEILRAGGMTETNINNCYKDKDGKIHLKTIREDLAGKKHEDTGVEYVRKTINVNGVEVEGVFPKYKSDFICKLSKENYKVSDTKQFSECMDRLRNAVDSDPELAKKFSKRQLEQIRDPNATIISGYTWHHNEEVGKMELVKAKDHSGSGHTGGKSIWGGGH